MKLQDQFQGFTVCLGKAAPSFTLALSEKRFPNTLIRRLNCPRGARIKSLRLATLHASPSLQLRRVSGRRLEIPSTSKKRRPAPLGDCRCTPNRENDDNANATRAAPFGLYWTRYTGLNSFCTGLDERSPFPHPIMWSSVIPIIIPCTQREVEERSQGRRTVEQTLRNY